MMTVAIWFIGLRIFQKVTGDKMNLDEKLILQKLDELEVITSHHYLEVYCHLIEYCKRQETQDLTTLVGLAHMIYGWMPTILTFDTNVDYNDKVYDEIRNGSLEKEFLVILKDMVNNSIVGVSKLLHFMNDKDYAIWDSRVYISITGKKGHNYKVNNIDTYIAYIMQIRALAECMDMDYIKSELISKGYCTGDESNLRLLELILFYTS